MPEQQAAAWGMTIAQEAEKTTAVRQEVSSKGARARVTAGAKPRGRPSAVQRRDAIDHGGAPARCCSVERGSSLAQRPTLHQTSTPAAAQVELEDDLGRQFARCAQAARAPLV